MESWYCKESVVAIVVVRSLDLNHRDSDSNALTAMKLTGKRSALHPAHRRCMRDVETKADLNPLEYL